MAGAFKLSPETFAGWWTPMEALAYTAKCVGLDGASKALWQLLVGGMITAIASSSSETIGNYSPNTTTEPQYIPGARWKDLTNTGSDLWDGAYVRFWNSRGTHPATYLAFGIKFNPNDVRINLPPPNPIHEADIEAKAKPAEAVKTIAEPANPTELAKATNTGGRPRKEWWDDFWIEICRRIWIGDLQPKTQADLARAMFEWVENHPGADAGETTINAAARKLFRAWDLRSKT